MFLLGGGIGFFDFDACVCDLKINQEPDFFHFFMGLDKPRFYVALVCSAQPDKVGQCLESMELEACMGRIVGMQGFCD